MKKQEKFDREQRRLREYRERRWAAIRETVYVVAFLVLIMGAAGIAQWFMS